MAVHDLLYNLTLSGILTAGAHMLLQRTYRRTMAVHRVKPVAIEQDPDERTKNLAGDLRTPLEDFLRTELDEHVGRRGVEFDHEGLFDHEVLRHGGVMHEEVFVEPRQRPEQYRFILTFTSARQEGMEVVQPYVTLLTKAVAEALTDLAHPVAITAIGKDYTVVKRFQDPLDASAIDNVRVDPVLNLTQGIEATAAIALEPSPYQTIVFCMMNGRSPIHDQRYKPSTQFDHVTKVFAYQIGQRRKKDPFAAPPARPRWMEHLPHALAGSYDIASVEGLRSTFQDFLKHGKPYL